MSATIVSRRSFLKWTVSAVAVATVVSSNIVWAVRQRVVHGCDRCGRYVVTLHPSVRLVNRGVTLCGDCADGPVAIGWIIDGNSDPSINVAFAVQGRHDKPREDAAMIVLR